MQKRNIVLFLLLITAISLIFSACGAKRPNVEYIASEGGHIEGEASQTIKSGGSTSPVTAVPDEGYEFDRWSDGNTDPNRSDSGIVSDTNIVALFKKTFFLMSYRVQSDGKNPFGYIEGETAQFVKYNEAAKPVTAIPYEGYMFDSWSDGNTDPHRQDAIVTAQKVYTALFKPLVKNIEFMGNLSSTYISDMSIGYDSNLSDLTLPVPQRVNSKFDGWFADENFTDRVSDNNGKVLLDKETFFAQTSQKLFAKYTPLNEVRRKVLIVYVTEVEGDFALSDDETVHFKYSMSDNMKQVCNLITQNYKKMFDSVFKGLVTFDIEAKFTTQPIGEECFERIENAGKIRYALYAEKIPEIDATLFDNYDTVMTFVRLDNYKDIDLTDIDYDEFISLSDKLYDVKGNYNSKFVCCNFLKLGNVSYDACGYLLKGDNQTWATVLGSYAVAYVHSIEYGDPGCATNCFDELYNMYISNIQTGYFIYSKEFKPFFEFSNELGLSALYLTDRASLYGKNIGIPYSYWEA